MSLKGHLKIMTCVKGNTLFHCSHGNDLSSQVDRQTLIKEQTYIIVVLTPLICKESH